MENQKTTNFQLPTQGEWKPKLGEYVQDLSNITGIVIGFGKCIDEIRVAFHPNEKDNWRDLNIKYLKPSKLSIIEKQNIAVSNTYGKGINPEAVPELLANHITDEIVIKDFLSEGEKSWDIVEYFLKNLLTSTQEAIKKAGLNND